MLDSRRPLVMVRNRLVKRTYLVPLPPEEDLAMQ